MKQATVGLVTATLAALSVVALAGQSTLAPQAPKPIASHGPGLATPESQTAVVKRYCTGCHSDRGKAGNLSLASFDAAKVTSNVEIAEKMIRKLRAGMMPPAGAQASGARGAHRAGRSARERGWIRGRARARTRVGARSSG